MLVWILFCSKTESVWGEISVTWKHDSFWSLCLHAALLLFAVPVRAQVGQKPPAMGIPESPNLVGDTTALAGEAQGWLADLIKINTTNPPGNEQAAAKYIGGILNKEGIPFEILDLAPGRSAIVARLRSSAVPDPSKRSEEHTSELQSHVNL